MTRLHFLILAMLGVLASEGKVITNPRIQSPNEISPSLQRDMYNNVETDQEPETYESNEDENCIEKIKAVEEVEYVTEMQCSHEIQESCMFVYKTNFKPVEQEECKEAFQKDCHIEYESVANELKIEICRDVFTRNCSIQGEETCSTEYGTVCETTYEVVEVEESVPNCQVVKDEKCDPAGNCYMVPRMQCQLSQETVKKTVPTTDCKQESTQVCGPETCPLMKGQKLCEDQLKVMVQQVPRETCTLNPQKVCSPRSKVLPQLERVEQCLNVPREICHNTQVPKTIIKEVRTIWCGGANETATELATEPTDDEVTTEFPDEPSSETEDPQPSEEQDQQEDESSSENDPQVPDNDDNNNDDDYDVIQPDVEDSSEDGPQVPDNDDDDEDEMQPSNDTSTELPVDQVDPQEDNQDSFENVPDDDEREDTQPDDETSTEVPNDQVDSEEDDETDSEPCLPDWTFNGTSCYINTGLEFNWNQGRQYCESLSLSTTMIKIQSESEMTFIKDFLSNEVVRNAYWTVGKALSPNEITDDLVWSPPLFNTKPFVWVNRDNIYETFDFTFWGETEPHTDGVCVSLFSRPDSRKWVASGCDNKNKVVCEQPANLPF